MNMNQKWLGFILASSLTLGTLAFAQQAKPTAAPSAPAATTASLDLIAGYQSIATSLEAARTSVTSDPPGALARVQGAQNVFRRLEPQIGTQKLIDAGTKALKNAASMVNQRSAINIGAQSMLVKSILQRVMYDRLFSDINAGKIPNATRYANTLAGAFNMPAANLNTLKSAVKRKDIGKARSILESQVADIMTNSLKLARDNVADKSTAYQAVVRASSHFLIVQDSPRVSEDLTVSSFANAVQSITSGDVPGFKQGIATLLTRTQDFGKRARGIALSDSNPAPSTTPTNTVPTPVVPNNTNPSNPSNPSAPTIKPSTPAIAPITPVATTPSGFNTINNELVKAGIPAVRAGALATSLANQKFASFGGVLDKLSATVGEALTQVQNGDVQAGRANLELAKNVFESNVKPALEVVNTDQAAQTSKVFDATVGAIGVRSVDVAVLLGEVVSVKNLFQNAQPANAMQNLSASVQPWWAGTLRGILFFVAALLFCYAIYLLNLAFGGKNPYWRYIGISMVLLFIPPLLEGLAWLGSVLSQTAGLTFLDGLSSLSVLQNPLAQIVWAILMIAAAGFATAGFRGIATQFGLIRNRSNQTNMGSANVSPAMLGAAGGVAGAAAMSNNPSLINTSSDADPRISSDVSVNPDRTIVEWDEEF
jgi:hypothetical protein